MKYMQSVIKQHFKYVIIHNMKFKSSNSVWSYYRLTYNNISVYGRVGGRVIYFLLTYFIEFLR